MVLAHRRLVRVIKIRNGTRYLVQVPDDSYPTPGWRVYALLALGLDGEEPVRLTLYERTADLPEDSDGPQPA